ncbi:MAG: glycosyltransferase [Saprospiraceae bacterium]|nr:glycosyltransferase [Saprospiraceae bacterium]
MKNKPDISICMITYNHEHYIRHAIEGVLMQKTNFDYELVVVNDCSTDKTDQVIKDIMASHENGNVIKYQAHDKNMGMMANFACALNLCQGRYIALCEGDDYWSDPNKLQVQTEFLEQNKTYALVGHNAKFIKEGRALDEVVRKVEADFLDFSTSDMIMRNPFVSSMTLFKNIGFENFKTVLDNFIVGDKALFTLLSFYGKIRFYSDPVGYYRKHAESVTSQNRIEYLPFKKDLINRIKHAEYWNAYSNYQFDEETLKVKEYRSRVLVGQALRNFDLKTAVHYSKFVDLNKIRKKSSRRIIGFLNRVESLFN